MSEIQVMRGVLGTQSTPNRWVRLKEMKEGVELYVMSDGNTYAAALTAAEARCLADQLFELALRLEAPAPIRRDDRGRFAA